MQPDAETRAASRNTIRTAVALLLLSARARRHGDLEGVEEQAAAIEPEQEQKYAGDPEDALRLHPGDFPRVRLKQANDAEHDRDQRAVVKWRAKTPRRARVVN